MTEVTESDRDRERRAGPLRATHGLTQMKRAMRELGSRAIDGRSVVAKALSEWRTDLVQDLGGRAQISPQQAATIELAVKTKLILDSIDAWLLSQPSLIDRRRRRVLPVVRERQQLADALARYMMALGLERKTPAAKTMTEVLQELDAENGVRELQETGTAPSNGSALPV